MKHDMKHALATLALGGLIAVSLSACGSSSEAENPAAPETEAEASSPAPAPEEDAGSDDTTQAGGGEGVAELSYGDTTFTASLASCMLGEDALFHGAATDGDGAEVGYLDGDFGGLQTEPYGEMRIDFGATEQFESSDSFIAMGDSVGEIVVTDSSDTSLIIIGGVWDDQGTQLATGTLRVNCE